MTNNSNTQYSNFCFTLYDFDENYKEMLKNIYTDTDIQYMVFQKEKCPKTDKLHLQGYAETLRRHTRNPIKKMFKSNTIHIEKRRGTQQEAITYCQKLDSRIEEGAEFGEKKKQGERNDLKEIYELVKQGKKIHEIMDSYPQQYIRYGQGIRSMMDVYKQEKTRKIMEDRTSKIKLRPWQKEIISRLENQDDRKILWVYDKLGNSGKTTLNKYLHFTKDFFTTSASKKADITYKYDGQSYLSFDFSRTNQEYINYGLMENFKDGMVESTKYMTCDKYCPDAKIIVFSNDLPNFTAWTEDRYDIAILKEGKLTYKNKEQMQAINNLYNKPTDYDSDYDVTSEYL